MSRFLVLVAVGFVLWLVLEAFWARVRLSMGMSARPLNPPRTGRAQPAAELVLVRCAGCGVHVPSPKVVAGGDGPLCDQCRQRRDREARG